MPLPRGRPTPGDPADSFDHLVGAREERLWHGEAERLGGLEIDDQLDPGALVDRQIGGFLTLEDPSGVNADLVKGSREARSIADQAAGSGVITKSIDRRKAVKAGQTVTRVVLALEAGPCSPLPPDAAPGLI